MLTGTKETLMVWHEGLKKLLRSQAIGLACDGWASDGIYAGRDTRRLHERILRVHFRQGIGRS